MCVLLSVFSPIKTEENPMAVPTSRIFSGFLICSNIRRSSPDSLRIIGRSVEKLSGSWDFIFMDAAKGQYIHFMPEVMRLLAPGGILVSDNVLQDGDIFESRYGIKRRNHTIHNRMREYLYALTHDEALDTVILETGDGMAISVKKE